jgi:hypothetical protein
MQTRWLSLLPLIVLAAACSAPDSSQPDDLGDGDVHNIIDETAANEPLPGLPGDTDTGEETVSTYEDPLTLAGNNCVVGGLYCGGDKVTGDHNTLYRCHGSKVAPTVEKHCTAGCKVNSGNDDSCAAAPAPCSITNPPHVSYLKWGLHPDASDALKYLNVTAGRVMQTIGNASASAGTHGQDGTAGGHAYSAATDLSVSGMSDAQIKVFLKQLTNVGFVPFYRNPGHDGWPSGEARHLHVIWAGAKMKLSLRNQVRDWHVGKNGLASHTKYSFYTWTQCWRDSIWKRFDVLNSATN